MKICIVAGARPNFIKVAPLIRAIDTAREAGHDIEASLVYTGSKNDMSPRSSMTSASASPTVIWT